MSEPREPSPVYFFSSVIYREREAVEEAIGLFSENGWAVRRETEPLEFSHTDYYFEEMGKPLKRIFLFLHPLRERELLVDLKHFTYTVEKKLSVDGKRRVNIDPGYLTLENIVLSTFKNYSHRIYLGRGVFAEVTLIYRNGTYHPLPWTYPDYASEDYIKLFNAEREEYRKMRK